MRTHTHIHTYIHAHTHHIHVNGLYVYNYTDIFSKGIVNVTLVCHKEISDLNWKVN